jgi:hypothetical protein
MPTNTFFNLSLVKQEKIISAAINEFARVPYAEVSINKIIKSAEISRGSFYLYFSEKYDLLVFLITKLKEEMNAKIKKRLENKKASLDELFVIIHETFFSYQSDVVIKRFITNILIYLNGNPNDEKSEISDSISNYRDCLTIYEYLDQSDFRFRNKEKIIQILDIAYAILKNVLFVTSVNNYNYIKSKELLNEYIDLLKYGYLEGKKC